MDLTRFVTGSGSVLDTADKPVSDADLEGLATRFPKLSRVALHSDQVTNTGLSHLAQLRSLVFLDIEGTSVTTEGLDSLSRQQKLECLVLNFTGVCEAEYLSALRELKRLRTLHLCDTFLTNEGVGELSSLKLTTLTLSRTSIDDVAMAHLAEMATLEWLDVEENEVTDDGLGYLAGLTRLKHLNLTRTKITNAGLATVGAMSLLEELYLSHTSTSDDGIPHLANLSKLSLLHYEGTKISPVRLKAAGVLRCYRSIPISIGVSPQFSGIRADAGSGQMIAPFQSTSRKSSRGQISTPVSVIRCALSRQTIIRRLNLISSESALSPFSSRPVIRFDAFTSIATSRPMRKSTSNFECVRQ